jgi:hypothetical protein
VDRPTATPAESTSRPGTGAGSVVGIPVDREQGFRPIVNVLGWLSGSRERKMQKNAHFWQKGVDGAREGYGQKSAFSLGKSQTKKPPTISGERRFVREFGGAGGI